MIRTYRAEDGILGYEAGDVLICDDGTRARAVRTGAGIQLEALPAQQGSACDRCGEFIADIDAGFNLGLPDLRCECGGTWTSLAAP